MDLGIIHVAALRGKKIELEKEQGKPYCMEIGKVKAIEIIKVELLGSNQKDKKRTKRERS